MRAVENAEKGSGIEEYFARQDLRFAVPESFVEQTRAVIASGGDLLNSEHIRPDNTTGLFDDVGDYFFDADLTVANLETPFAPSRPQGCPPADILKAPPLNGTREMLRVFLGDGDRIGFVSTANNHSLDQGVAGLQETLDLLDAEDCGHVGTARTAAEREDIPVVELNGIRVAFVSYTFSVNGQEVPAGEDHAVNYVRLNLPGCDLSVIERHVRVAREVKDADVVVACMHWGLEFESYPVQNLIDTGHRLARLGIDVVLGNHPHGVQPMERYRFTEPGTGVDKDALIVYAHGDITSYQPAVPNSMLGNLVRLTLAKGTEQGRTVTRVAHVDFLPTYSQAVFDGGRCVDFRLRDLSRALAEAEANPDADASCRRELRRLTALAQRLLPTGSAAARG